ncbi:MAG: MBOAT family protein [Bacteroidaceae bacterium]|nr:MBOAT family protein [Bacteroidaceae bacterium]
MVFNSFAFIIFFAVVYLLLCIERFTTKRIAVRNALLLVASYVFYGWFNVGFLLVLLYVTLVNYITGELLLKGGTHCKRTMGIGVVLSLLPLLCYKYTAFIVTSIQQLCGIISDAEWLSGWVMPIGISFFTFQALSYSIDVYRGKITEHYSLPDFMLFVAFFPTVLSGPIEKARNLLPQLRAYRAMTANAFMEGAVTFIWGLFKKIVIADRLCAYVNMAYTGVEYQSGATLALAAILYSIQIYCDFSGYSDMAWGVAKALGFDVTRNFRFPYFATTIKEFWRRWHISLTSWFTEYVYFSLGGNRVRLKARWVFNISMVFVLSGIWHGASWNFLLWGALHAVYYLIEYACGIHRKGYETPRLLKLPATLLVFVLVTIAWIFFRIEDFSTATYVVGKIFTDMASPIATGGSAFTFVCNLFLVVLFIAFDWLLYRKWLISEDNFAKSSVMNVLWVVVLLILLGLFSVSADNFVYFQF